MNKSLEQVLFFNVPSFFYIESIILKLINNPSKLLLSTTSAIYAFTLALPLVKITYLCFSWYICISLPCFLPLQIIQFWWETTKFFFFSTWY